MRRFARLAGTFAALAIASAASAETGPSPAKAAAVDPALLRPCTAPGCAGGTSSSWNQAAGFGAATLAAIWLARWRHAPIR